MEGQQAVDPSDLPEDIFPGAVERREQAARLQAGQGRGTMTYKKFI